MATKKKTFTEKLNDDKDLPRVVEINEKMSKRWGTGTCVIPAPREVNEIMRLVPKGKLITINQIREVLAKRHKASIGWPITTGIFVGIAARAAVEAIAEGRTDITPYWRTLKSKGELNEKYPGGAADQSKKLRAEGHTIEMDKTDKPKRIKDWEKKLLEV
jgi:alkylated DNA nucleotide flippase Atl1